MKAANYLVIILIVFMVFSCEKEKTGAQAMNNDNSEETVDGSDTIQNSSWLIPKDEVLDGGPGKDGIPALSNADFINASDAAYLEDDDLILGFVDGNIAKAYPHSILNYHEIINDDINNVSMAVIYCPLTGTGIGWNRKINNQITTFGVSGLLYNSNVIPYDRLTNSLWSQMLLKSVNGTLINTPAETYNLVETSWSTWKKMYPLSKVVSLNTGYSRNYSKNPYGAYGTLDVLFFPVNNEDSRLFTKERVLGILISEKAKAYSIEDFESNDISKPISLINDKFQNTDLVIVGSKKLNFIVAFKNQMSDGSLLEFQAVQNLLPTILIDTEGTNWDIMGNAISGPRVGEKLERYTQFMGFWFAWSAFYPNIELYGDIFPND